MTIDLKHITVAFDYASGDIADIKKMSGMLIPDGRGNVPT